MKRLARSKSALVAVLAAGSLALAGAAQADEGAGEAVIVGEEIAVVETTACPDCPAGNTGMISLAAGVDFADKYFYRGYTQQTSGVQIQPWAELDIQLTNHEGPFGDLTLFVGVWNSINSKGAGLFAGGVNQPSTQDPSNWYESDFYVGLATSLGAGVSASVSYVGVFYPSVGGDALPGDRGEIDLTLSYDDSDLLGDFSISPYVLFAFGIHNFNFATGGDGGYVEIGGEPSYTIGDGAYAPTLSLPFNIGFSLYDDYYGRNDVGWGQLGLAGSVPLGFVPASYGSWSASAGIYGIWQSAFVRDFAGADRAWQPNFIFGISADY